MSNGIMIDARDNVVVATDDIRAGERIEYHIPGTSQVASVTPTSDIPLFLKWLFVRSSVVIALLNMASISGLRPVILRVVITFIRTTVQVKMT